jgi:succinate dehydrogenase flavin-adding protein (antitoxin of CptAB toxin-antitoxin module)
VAQAMGQKTKDVALDDYAVTLFTFLQLEDARRLDRLVEESDRLDMAWLNAKAFNRPEMLREASAAFQRKIQNVPDRETVLRLAAEIWKKANQQAPPKEIRGRIRAKSKVPD